MKMKNESPKTAFGFLALCVVAGIIGNLATAPVVRKYNQAKAKINNKVVA